MLKIDFPVAFLDVESLENRWNCGLNIIQTMAETEKIRFFLRPVVLELALDEIGLAPTTMKKLQRHHIDYRDVHLLFKNKTEKIPVRGFCIPSKSHSPLIYAEFCDLIIPLDNVEAFEHLYCANDQYNQDLHLLSDDFTCFIWRGREFTFGEMQAKVIKRLWQAREDGTPWMYGKRILTDIGAGSNRIQSIFNHNTLWKSIILSDKNGKYRLNLPPKPIQ